MKIDRLSWGIFIFLSFIWGSSFILIEKSLLAFNPYQVASLRIGISTIAFVPIFFFSKYKVPRDKLKYIFLVGLTGSGIPAFMYAIAETELESALTGILNSLTPIFTLVFAVLFFGVSFKKRSLIGVLIGFLGALFLIIFDTELMTFKVNPYALFVLVGTVCYGISGNLVKTYCQNVHPLVLTAFSFFCIGPFAISYLFFSDWQAIMTHESFGFSILSVSILAIVCTVAANGLFFSLIQRTNAIFSSSISYLIPVMALVWGFIDQENIHYLHLMGLSLILSGIYVLRK